MFRGFRNRKKKLRRKGGWKRKSSFIVIVSKNKNKSDKMRGMKITL
jgi:hypothetical protein